MAAGPSIRITPWWLRPVTAGAVVLAHAGLFIGVPWPNADAPAVAAPIAVQVVPMGKPAEVHDAPQQAQVAEVTAMEAKASTAQPQQARPVEPPKLTEAIKPVEERAVDEPQEAHETKVAEASALVPEAELQAVEKEQTALKPVETVERQVPQPKPKPKHKPKPKRHVAKHEPKRHDRKRQHATASSRASALAQRSQARAVTGSIGSANYRSIVAAELNRRKFYPPAARAIGAHGVVVVTFTVGASGRVVHHAIRRSSGQVVLDRAVHQIMAAISLPPPPGNRFRATVPIRFDITR